MINYIDNRKVKRIISEPTPVDLHATNHLGGYDDCYYDFSLTGRLLGSKHVHSATGQDTHTETLTCTYDHADRPFTTIHRIDEYQLIMTACNTYDEQGRLATNLRNGNTNLQTAYAYNIRSWVTGITSPLFTESLYYNESHDGNMPLWSGNISAQEWTTDNTMRGYNFTYDGLSRLTQAAYRENDSSSSKYTTQYTYDSMGNPLTLKRRGKLDDGSFGLVDDLTYTYEGNRLLTVTDANDDEPTYQGAFHFSDGADEDEEYTYDDNGNMTMDLNKGIANIDYNLLNLPSLITFQDSSKISCLYDADGRKLRVTYTGGILSPTPNVTHTVDYCGNYVYEDGTLSRILIDGGYVTFEDSQPLYHFYIQDHLGSNRVVVSQYGVAEQVNHYYPYGGIIADISTNQGLQRHKYNGKEYDRMYGLNLYDYGARHYDPATLAWTTKDPFAEKYYPTTPYGYCGDNPINRIDPNGLDWYQDEFGHLQWNSDLNADNWQDILSKDSKYLGTTAYSFEHESGIAYFGDENGVLSPYRPFGAEGVVVTGTNLSNTLKAQLFGNSGSIPAGQYSSPNADAISIGIGGSLSLCGIDYGIEAGLIVGNGIISPYVSVYGDIDISSLFNSYRKMPNLAKMIGFNYYGSVMLYNQLGPYENNFNKYSGDGSASTFGMGNLGFVKGKGISPKGEPVSDMYGITINSSPVVYSKERIKTWIPFSH